MRHTVRGKADGTPGHTHTMDASKKATLGMGLVVADMAALSSAALVTPSNRNRVSVLRACEGRHSPGTHVHIIDVHMRMGRPAKAHAPAGEEVDGNVHTACKQECHLVARCVALGLCRYVCLSLA